MNASAAQVQNRRAHAGQQATDGTPGVLRASLRLLFWLFVALLFSIVIEWIGMLLWWPEQGAAHSEAMLADELGYLSGDLRATLLVSDTAAYAQAFADTAYHWLWQRTGLESAIAWIAATPPAQASTWQAGLHEGYARVADFIVAAATITQVFAVRLAVLTLAMPAFALAILVGVLDGLVLRDLRRWGGGRESSYLYHHAKRWIWPLFITAWVLYLSLPFSVHPAFSILPFAALIGLLVAITAASFKKYL
ncbi:MAG: TIGR03747 family integrating conjugative element membrane protein [Chromatiaceae bacterium]|nr:TIGR03747 family integrating conjugative element membrane protein [Chromatiaceae bacterium]